MSFRHDHPHTHQRYGLGQLANHLRVAHKQDEDGPPLLSEEHQHGMTMKVGDNYAARIDVHPWAMPRLSGAPVIFASMEGCPKADAILTSILEEDLPASVYSFPSVTLGKCPELSRFASEYLEGKTVVAVLDNDWADPSKRGAVENQGRIYQGKLLNLGVASVHLAAPPYTPGMKKLGVDDFLGAEQGHLSELICIDVKPPEDVEGWLRAWHVENGVRHRSDGIQSLARILTGMAVFAGTSGELRVTLSCMANAMGVVVSNVTRAVQKLVDMGALEVDGNLNTGPSYFGGGDDWVARPTIRIVSPALRATALPHRTLGDVLGPAFFGRQG